LFSYGKTITNLMKHRQVQFVDEEEMAALHNDPYHHRTETIDEDCFEVFMNKKAIRFNLPMNIGLSVYAYAKLRMLEFVYDVVLKFIDNSDFMLNGGDTDSVILSLAAETIDECVKPDLKAEFENIKHLWFVMDEAQRRVPGLMKVETLSNRFIGLCSKCYITDSACKAKGVQSRNKEIMTFENFRKVLFDESDAQYEAVNVGIRPVKQDVRTYVQFKQGLTNLYVKRICLPDGSTKPLLL
jgi:hypothetical protein